MVCSCSFWKQLLQDNLEQTGRVPVSHREGVRERDGEVVGGKLRGFYFL